MPRTTSIFIAGRARKDCFDLVTQVRNPILHAEWDSWKIVERERALTNYATEPTDLADQGWAFEDQHANGTGLFVLESRKAVSRTSSTRIGGTRPSTT